MNVRCYLLNDVYDMYFCLLQNNMDQDVCVRVIRGHKCASSYTRKVYTYDGLYKVEHIYDYDFWLLSKNSIIFLKVRESLFVLIERPPLMSNHIFNLQ
jgi:hypothetical protein